MDKTQYLLACLSEECAKTIRAVAEAQRFGLDDNYQAHDTPRGKIELQICFVLAALEELVEQGVLLLYPESQQDIVVANKRAKIREYMEYARRSLLGQSMEDKTCYYCSSSKAIFRVATEKYVCFDCEEHDVQSAYSAYVRFDDIER